MAFIVVQKLLLVLFLFLKERSKMKSVCILGTLESNKLNILVTSESKSKCTYSVCNKSWNKTQSVVLKMEKLKVIEIDQKPHKCPKCKVRFTDRKNIPRHIKNVHEKSALNQMFQCIHCEKLYASKGNHDSHFEKTHMFEYLLYMEPKTVTVKGKKILHIFKAKQSFNFYEFILYSP